MRSTGRLLATALALTALLALLTMGVVLGRDSQLDGKLLTGSDVTIAADETLDHDVYVFSGTFTSNGTINGDIVAAGGSINVNGPVNGDVLAAAGQVSINGPVNGDVRATGGQIAVLGDVAEDVVATGGQLTLSGRVGQDVIVAGGQLTLTGSVAGSATGSVGTYSKTGSVDGTDSIVVTGNQGTGFLPPPPSEPLIDALRHFISVLLVALLALWLTPRLFEAAEGEVRRRPLPSFGWGLVVLIGYCVAIVAVTVLVIVLATTLAYLGFGWLLAIDLFGGFIAVSGVTLGFIIAVAFVADAIVGLALARWVMGLANRPAAAPAASNAARDRWSDLGLLVVGVAAIVVLTSLPIIGPWAKLVVVLLGLGALWPAWRRLRVTGPGDPPTPSLPQAPAAPAAGWR